MMCLPSLKGSLPLLVVDVDSGDCGDAVEYFLWLLRPHTKANLLKTESKMEMIPKDIGDKFQTSYLIKYRTE
jgi:hypothetical protein